MTQREIIKQHLINNGSITTMEAITNYSITRLSARIWDIRHKDNWLINSKTEYGVNKFGKPVMYDRYTLVEQ